MFRWSINLFRIGGIRLAVHWTFGGLLAYECYRGWQSAGLPGLFWSGCTLIAFFGCVVLHELGHSLTARRFGIGVRRILLTPIGGIAEFERIPRNPVQELLITVAGPSVNFVIAAILYLVVGFPSDYVDVASLFELGQVLLVWNLVMGLFNLIPAFPMDGGRILRALLAFKLPYVRATYWAATVGKIVMVPGAIYELYLGNYLTVCICIFIFSAGQAEYEAVRRAEEYAQRWRELSMRHVGPEGPGPQASEPPVIGP